MTPTPQGNEERLKRAEECSQTLSMRELEWKEEVFELQSQLKVAVEELEQAEMIVCYARCPSTWVTAEGRKHSAQCIRINAAITKLKDSTLSQSGKEESHE